MTSTFGFLRRSARISFQVGAARQVAVGQVENDEMTALDVGLHAGDQEDAAFAGVGDRLRGRCKPCGAR